MKIMTIKTTIFAIGATTLITGACIAGILNGSDSAIEAAHSTPASLPTATTTIRLPGATTTITPPAKVVTKYLPQATKTITKTIIKKVPQATIICGHAEDDCYPDYLGKGRWVIRHGERPMPKATTSKKVPEASKKVPKATTYKVCSNRRITKAMVADCNKLAARPKVIDAQGNETPNGRVLVAECLESYDNALELALCLAPPSN
jgi:hypothetical protein